MAKRQTQENIQIKREVKAEVKGDGIERVSSGLTLLDCCLGGGYGWGKIINIVGDRSSGKTLVACELIAKARSIYGDKLEWYYDDAESGFSFDTQSMYGFEINSDESGSETIEQFSVNFKNKLDELEDGKRLIYILDSLDSLSSEAEIKRDKERRKAADAGKDFDKGTYGMERQKYLGEFFRLRRLEIAEKKCLLVVISQVRDNIGVTFGDKHSRVGGKALDFYAAQIIWLAEVEKQKKKGLAVGITSKAKVKKNKIGIPFRECYFNVLFDYGLDDVSSSIDFLLNLKTPQGKLSDTRSVEWDGKRFTRDMLIKHIEENGLQEELADKVRAKWEALEAEVKTERRRKYE